MSVKYKIGKMEHIRPEKINAYMEGLLQGEEAMAIEGHLAVCDECLKIHSGLKELGRALKGGFSKVEATRDCPEDWVLGALIKGEVTAEGLGAAENHIKTCGYCLDRTAAYYKASENESVSLKASDLWKEKAVGALQGAREEVAAPGGQASGFAKVFHIFNKYTRLLPPLPGYALAAAMAVLLILVAMPERTRIVTIASTEKLAFKSDGALSSFGFMGTEKVESFTGMEIVTSGTKLEFGWKKIPGAGEYIVTIAGRASGEEVLTEVKTTVPGISVPVEKFKDNELYSWSISGTSKDVEAFEYTGEFLVFL